ncbi:SDR family oxidoreductase [Planctomonas psychrotolerans]|uniref:SDR family oxidoreductase n=1 Tax=Planctomonas psychrotolerans TaxID=2528712 RepID=UPI001238E7F4|nr:SDR family oxidoreductase [Planctomonas psychrotolerans]
MRIAIAGGHGKIARLLERQLADAGHQAVAIIRNADQTADIEAEGAEALVLDLEQTDADTLAAALNGVDAVVFAAGAGPGSGAKRKLTIDRDGAILLADAAERAGIRRYVLVSAIATDDFDSEAAQRVDSDSDDDVSQVYLRAKSEADAAVRERDLDWTIVRPGGLTDEPGTGLVTLAISTGRSSIPRADVAAIVATSLVEGVGIRQQFEAISGGDTVSDALATLRY